MIIDATKGSIARFVNHSCKPNCRMVKWIVGGKPRMALFAGPNPIMTGEELTYDYNFDPFSAKNIQECRCGSDNCRGVLGPKPKDVKPVKEAIKDVVKAGKRKLKELLGDDSDGEIRSPKKRKTKAATGVKRLSSLKAAKGAAKAIKRGAAQMLNPRTTPKRTIKKTLKASLLKSSGRGQLKVSSRKSSLTVVKQDGSPRVKRKYVRKSMVKSVRGVKKSRNASASTIRAIAEPIDPDETEVDEDLQ